jgi:pyridoxamine 5'-phosphate oxidase
MRVPPAVPLLESDLDPDPVAQLRAWLREAEGAGVALPEAMALATASAAGDPSARMVLLKGCDERGLVFHTNYESRKARDLTENPRAAALLYWTEIGRQARIEGRVARVAEAESEAYFRTRPVGAQLGAWASWRQSEVIAGRDVLEERVEVYRAEYAGGEVPLPPFWGGYRLAPDLFEFWQHRDDRLHDRFRYRRVDGGWVIERLAP